MNANTINDDVTIAGEGARALLMNRYRIIKQLGQGGMGSVWLAEDTQLDGKLFAIKMLPSILVSNKRAYQQLKAEALVSMKLTHPNIVTLRAFEENDGNPFLVMDYIRGKNLDDCIAEWGMLGEAEVKMLLKPIAEALDYAHSKGVVHRDVKPSNVMITEDYTPYILDFGIAREMQETMTRVTGKLSSGTLLYMSPEQLHGASPKKEQDIYSFAAMIYECLKGNPPFCRGQVEYQIDHDTPEPLPKGMAIAASVMAGLAKTPDERPKSCMAVLAGEVKSPAAIPNRSKAPARPEMSAAGLAKRRLGIALAAGLALLGIVGGAFWYFNSQQEEKILAPSRDASEPQEDPVQVKMADDVDGSLCEISSRVVDSMGERTWIITDGLIDDSLLLAAEKKGKKINIISLNKEGDRSGKGGRKLYLKNLADKVLAEELGGEKLAKELAKILIEDYGVERQRLLPFIEHWFKSDPDVASKVVVWGAPHLWMNVDKGPLPELYFFGCEEEGKGPGDWIKEWDNIKQYLTVPKGWGSYRGVPGEKRGDVTKSEIKRRHLRRHIGFLATSQANFHHFNGMMLFECGKKAEAEVEFDKAFALYELVLNEIDPDNIVALINEDLLAQKNGFKKALEKHNVIKQALEVVCKDTQRRYLPVQLSLFYGAICDAEYMLKYGQALMAQRGQYEHGLYQMRRAVDLTPAEQSKLAELNILAHYFSEGSEVHKAESRKIYIEELQKNPGNRQALMRLSNLEVLEGNVEKAIDYLERAVKGVEDNPMYGKQVAQLYLLKNDLASAEKTLRNTIDSDPKDIHSWALLAHVLIRNIDNMGAVETGLKRAECKAALLNEIEFWILPYMKNLIDNKPASEAVYQSTRALFLMRKGGKDNIREARDSFEEVSKSRRGSSRTGDMILSLDMQLGDKAHAEEKAKSILIDNPNDPLANYIMGSLRLQRGDNETAEQHLRKAVTGKRQVPLAFNDLAEVLRRRSSLEEAEKYARKAVEAMPKFYVVWETLGSILMDAGKNFEEAEQYIQKACDLSKDAKGGAVDVRILISLTRVQIKRGALNRAKTTMGVVNDRQNELTEYERAEFLKLMKSVK